MSSQRSPWGGAQDWPGIVNAILVILVFCQWLASKRHDWLNLAAPVSSAASSTDVATLSIGGAGLATMTAGFAGVVVIFGLTGTTERFRVFRLQGGKRLVANWTSVVSSSFLAAFTCFIAAGLALSKHELTALWVLEAAVLISVHACVRLVWLLRALARMVVSGDSPATPTREAPLTEVFGSMPKSEKTSGSA